MTGDYKMEGFPGGKKGRESFIDRAMVESNRKLIEIFEAKIKAKLDEIWGAV